MHDHLRHIPVVMRFGSRHEYADGGLVAAAKDTSEAGRNGDDMIIHVNKDEFELLRQQWGEPTINPHTGMPEFFSFKSIAKKLAGPVAGIAANYLLPGSGVLGSSLGRALASGAVGAGVGALAGGKKGALYGGLAGAASPYLFGADGIGGDGGMLGNLLSGGLGGIGGALSGGANAAKAAGAATEVGPGVIGNGASHVGGAGGLGSLLAGGNAKTGLTALSMLAAGLGSGGSDKAGNKAAKQAQQQKDLFNAPVPVYDLARTQVQPQMVDYYNYGVGPERQYYNRNNEYDTVQAASGGYIEGAGDGRDDAIHAKLSDGEYVVDAETVSLLGDGSNEAGAQRLDEMRRAIRQHKGEALAQGEISPDAASPLQYLSMGRG